MMSRIIERNRAAGHRIAGDFRRSLTGTVAVTNGGKTLQFTLPGGFNGTGAAAGDVIQYNLVDDPTDADNGTDDNNNGVIDEKILTRTNVTTTETVTIGANFNEVDSGFVVNGTGVTCTLTTIGWTKGSKNVTKVQHATDLFPRN